MRGKYPISASILSFPFLSGHPRRAHKKLPLAFLSVSRASVASPLESDGGRFCVDDRARDCGRLQATHPFALAFSYVLGTSVPGPLNRAEACKENDVSGAAFYARDCFFQTFISPSFRRISPPRAIYLICFSMRMRREKLNILFSLPLLLSRHAAELSPFANEGC